MKKKKQNYIVQLTTQKQEKHNDNLSKKRSNTRSFILSSLSRPSIPFQHNTKKMKIENNRKTTK